MRTRTWLKGKQARWLRLGGACAWLAWAGCGALSWEERSADNEGAVCVGSSLPFAPAQVQLEAGVPFRVTVSADECLSSSCSRVQRSTCSIVLRDSELLLQSSFRWEERTRGSCTDDCQRLFAACETSEPVPPGSYTLSHGGARHIVDIPGVRDAGCF